MKLVRENKLILSRSSDRTLRAMGQVIKAGSRNSALMARAQSAAPSLDIPALGQGTQPEWLGKKVLQALGMKVPPGDLAKTAEDAVAIATRIGYPVAMKAQAAALAHKTEAGGVVLNLADADAVRRTFEHLHANVARVQPGMTLDGVLVEKMSAKGLELVIGGRRDPQWGPVILVGLGGIWVEALGDVRLMAPDLSEDEVIAELMKLKTAKLLKGFRGSPAVDVRAVAQAAVSLGKLMRAHPEIVEVDINPLMVHAEGAGATALDALIVTAGGATPAHH